MISAGCRGFGSPREEGNIAPSALHNAGLYLGAGFVF
jgi:hypothetical protein